MTSTVLAVTPPRTYHNPADCQQTTRQHKWLFARDPWVGVCKAFGLRVRKGHLQKRKRENKENCDTQNSPEQPKPRKLDKLAGQTCLAPQEISKRALQADSVDLSQQAPELTGEVLPAWGATSH